MHGKWQGSTQNNRAKNYQKIIQNFLALFYLQNDAIQIAEKLKINYIIYIVSNFPALDFLVQKKKKEREYQNLQCFSLPYYYIYLHPGSKMVNKQLMGMLLATKIINSEVHSIQPGPPKVLRCRFVFGFCGGNSIFVSIKRRFCQILWRIFFVKSHNQKRSCEPRDHHLWPDRPQNFDAVGLTYRLLRHQFVDSLAPLPQL